MDKIAEIGEKAKATVRILGKLGVDQKNRALQRAGRNLIARQSEILEANREDLENARKGGLKETLLDRLMLNEKRIRSMVDGLEQIVILDDPIGEVLWMKRRPNGLRIGQQRVPMGVVGMIYEARPNVTVDVAGLCLKTGNAVILRGGKEAVLSNKTIVTILREAIGEVGIPENAIQLVEDISHESVLAMMKMNRYIDVLIPRGGAGLIKSVVENSTVPVIKTGTGNCHVYVDHPCDEKMALSIIINAKTQRPGVCNAAESLLVHQDTAESFLPVACEELKKKGVEIRGDALVQRLVPWAKAATEDDWGTEYLDLILSVKVVHSVGEAIEHINTYGTGHSEAIITKDYQHAQQFLNEVDAAAVYVNASTRFTDGYEFGFGAEVGISTQKLHARGPMGLKELTTTKYIIYGEGQVRK